jgi:hypothetical protein
MPISEEQLSMLRTTLKNRIDGIDQWLVKDAPAIKKQQRHCIEDTVERFYWHYGYMMALKDVLEKLNAK